ncbi:MAG: 4-(cytidine 5'-diphospho)-2-C-methyl-D-erythritol kinase [Bacteroidales bacterium]|nr:4-(cytidine 5'-diphospho)-2-C-methyl-D-erythritol kinase [Bacteroidales bacterium]
MICFPNGKINIGLRIKGKREDGYHNLESVFYPVGIFDILEIIPTNKFSCQQTGIDLKGPTDRNLVVKAYQLMRSYFDIGNCTIHLHKNIPPGSGLGGGSADASFTIKLLNSLFKLGLKIQELEKLASKLGADCPFFIKNRPVFVSGIGDKLEPVGLDLTHYQIIVIVPNDKVSTTEAYLKVIPSGISLDLENILQSHPASWKNMIVNDFETAIFNWKPKIKRIRDILYQKGALYASMSGSGSAVYGIFGAKTDTNNLFDRDITWFRTNSLI